MTTAQMVLTTYYSLLTTFCFLLSAYGCTCYLLGATTARWWPHYSLLITHYSLLTTCYLRSTRGDHCAMVASACKEEQSGKGVVTARTHVESKAGMQRGQIGRLAEA